MAPELFKSVSRSAQQNYNAPASSSRASPALPVAGRRGGKQRLRPVKSTGAAAAAPLASRCSRHGPTSPRLASQGPVSARSAH
ncbi:hypothetical protein NDU88_011312 [Pleurodeles waltl]|uniref:Uncharacterized protein n=1 Tax=Pleurodeles waltl TaxID=8319 RepID=A0AAV7QYF9_PLEWA|nr:hypothetical protein NDU88_011312 [Pleurodeles waltl]